MALVLMCFSFFWNATLPQFEVTTLQHLGEYSHHYSKVRLWGSVSESARGAKPGTLVHGDLHYGNVLAADREPWLVIDPKPVSGDPHYEVAPMLWNRWEEVVASGRVRDMVRRRFHTVVDAAGLDEDRARDWVVVRALHNVLWALEDAQQATRASTPGERTWVTTMLTLAKAVQD